MIKEIRNFGTISLKLEKNDYFDVEITEIINLFFSIKQIFEYSFPSRDYNFYITFFSVIYTAACRFFLFKTDFDTTMIFFDKGSIYIFLFIEVIAAIDQIEVIIQLLVTLNRMN